MATAEGPKMLGRYELLFMLGQGGMGEVHLARISGVGGFEKLCIVKTILPQMQADPQFVDRFHHEARVLVHLTHSNIAQVYDMGDYERTLYMAIEYVPGVDLSRVQGRLSHSGLVMPLPMALYIGQQICEALGYAHRKMGPDGTSLGIVHRDVSPQNVMVSYEGEVKVIDFGLAKSAARSKHTLPSTVMGKLGYMSPEQAMARPVDHRSDIFSAGIVIWEMIAGRPLYSGATMGEMVAMMANPTIPLLRSIRPEVSPALDQVVQRALATDPTHRYSRCDEFARALNELAVREQLTVGAEEVGNSVRAMCAEEFAAERQLQSKLSLLRKRNKSGDLDEERAVPGTFLRGSDEAPIPLTPAQRALSAVATPTPGGPSAPKSEPSVIVGSGALRVSSPRHDSKPARRSPAPKAAEAEEEPQTEAPLEDDAPLEVPKNRAPLIVVMLVLLLAGGAAAYWAVVLRGATAVDGVAEPVEPKVKQIVGATLGDALDAGGMIAKNAEAAAATRRALVTPPSQASLMKVIRRNGTPYLLLEGQKVERGDKLRLVGEPVDGQKREIYGTAGVFEVNGALAELIVDEDEELPKEVFAFRDETAVAKPKRPARPVETGAPTTTSPTAATTTPPSGTTTTTTVTAPPMTTVPTTVAAVEPKPEPTSPAVRPGAMQPATAPATTAPADWAKQRTILGNVRLDKKKTFGGGMDVSVAVQTNERDTLSGCTVWLPSGKSSYYKNLESGRSIETPLEYFRQDPRPLDKNLEGGKYALVQCREGSGYFYFTNLK